MTNKRGKAHFINVIESKRESYKGEIPSREELEKPSVKIVDLLTIIRNINMQPKEEEEEEDFSFVKRLGCRY